LAALAGAASAFWLVKRRRALGVEADVGWARATAVALPVVFLGVNFAGPFFTWPAGRDYSHICAGLQADRPSPAWESGPLHVSVHLSQEPGFRLIVKE